MIEVCSGRSGEGQTSTRRGRSELEGNMLRLLIIAVVVYANFLQHANACSKEEYAAKFGALYELHGKTKNPPFVNEHGEIVAEVTYSTFCAGGGSKFTATNMDKGQPGSVAYIVMSRSAPECNQKLQNDVVFSDTIRVPLPKNISSDERAQWFLAFPPDGDYELYLLNPYKAPVKKTSAFEVRASPKEESAISTTTTDSLFAGENLNETEEDEQAHVPAEVHESEDTVSLLSHLADMVGKSVRI